MEIKKKIKKMLYINKYLTVDFAAERWGNVKLYYTLPESLKII